MRDSLKWIGICLILVQLVGCRGCTKPKTAKETAEEADAKKKKQRFVSYDLKAIPFSAEISRSTLKPGHWYQANHRLKANYNDEALTAALSVVNHEKTKIPFAPNQATVEFTRNVSLGVGQEKNVRFTFFQPEVVVMGDDVSKTPSAVKLLYSQRGIGAPVLEEDFLCSMFLGYQYNLVSLSRDPSRYLFWRGLDCIVWPSKQRMSDERIAPHRIVDLSEDEVATQFPSRLYAMTSISHFVLNDSSVSIMSTDQQQALLDWLYFGGTIILNGPEAIGGIETSVMKEYAPIIKTTNSTVTDQELAALNSTWTIKQIQGEKLLIAPNKPIPKLAGELAPGAQWVKYKGSNGELMSLDGLVAEKMFGQGRIVMTAFPMSDNAFLRWPSYSSFIHNAILQKPCRDPSTGIEADTKFAGEYEGAEQSPFLSTRMRLWARDLDTSTMRQRPASKKKSDEKSDEKIDSDELTYEDAASELSKVKRTSLGAWNPDSTVLVNARQCLQESSGITVPKINTIMKLLIGYLIVLVPVNWLFFRLFGRVELAWAAAPFIALAGAFFVARSVQLDVGFSRSQTSYGFLEVHSGYPRGLFSSYTALYTSLSTNYRAVFEKETGIVLPFSSTSNNNRTKSSINSIDYWYADDAGSGMQSVPVLSNTTGLFHAEEMIDFEGKLVAEFDDDKKSVEINNDLGFSINEAGIIGVNAQGKLISGWLGTAENGSTKRCNLEIRETDNRWRKEWDRNPILGRPNFMRAEDGTMWTDQDLQDELYLGPMLEDLTKKYPLGRGEYIAIGWTDSMLGGLSITPVAKQKKQRTVLLLHLVAAETPTVRPDTRIFAKIVEEPE